MAHTLTAADLDQFSGTEQYFRHGLIRSVLYTEGARHVAQAGGAYWLLDEIATGQMLQEVKEEEFQVWKLEVNRVNNTAVLRCEDGNDRVVYSKQIAFTDFPLDAIQFYFENSVICLPGER